MSAEKMTSGKLVSAIRTRYPEPEWFVAEQVADSTGALARRFADAVAVSIWPSRGYTIHGHEVKISRSDFLSEMKNPEKADAVMQHCDFWWLVVPAKLVDPSEIPATWGLLELTGSGLRATKKAPLLRPLGAGKAMAAGFAAALLRRSRDMEQDYIKRAVEAGNVKREAEIERRVEERVHDLKEKEARHRQWAEEFEAAYGEKPRSYSDPKKIAEAHKVAERILSDYTGLASVRRDCAAMIASIDALTEAAK